MPVAPPHTFCSNSTFAENHPYPRLSLLTCSQTNANLMVCAYTRKCSSSTNGMSVLRRCLTFMLELARKVQNCHADLNSTVKFVRCMVTIGFQTMVQSIEATLDTACKCNFNLLNNLNGIGNWSRSFIPTPYPFFRTRLSVKASALYSGQIRFNMVSWHGHVV